MLESPSSQHIQPRLHSWPCKDTLAGRETSGNSRPGSHMASQGSEEDPDFNPAGLTERVT
ncbi:hypothetical protein BDBG_16632 [Blastomyces gilchristii SLH14081]|uniref:Uncharacterized protein n=1 Tax=Blastomyces gilchristii (strain SLH14081) TaxID=559298 RepID=A0A179UFD2_BLAGS|nr:uncharacterized protein BDBG_16632 [Blastomyces gilchristii SLH14081]OAT06453.1 hypothetical protein BDBG_16632 [Blastomyces gilchristii SLH14081]